MKRIIVGISGASGVIYGIELLRIAKGLGVECHLVLSRAAQKNIELETSWKLEEVAALAAYQYQPDDMAAAISSGSFLMDGMVVIPCSIKTLSGIANSFDESLIIRAADVTLKEKRRLILVVRETPLHRGHLKLMLDAADLGAQILPPIPAFYHAPQTIEDLVHQTIGKIFDSLGIEHDLFRRWS